MSTGFNAQVGGGKYALQFETDRKDLFKTVQAACYNVMDRVEYERQGKSEPTPEPQSNWISVEDRLPEIDEYVLVFVTEGRDASGNLRLRDTIQVGMRFDDDIWEIDYAHVTDFKITHWMPLPKDPRGL